jgi:DNA-binding response OmpR family regulator
MALVLVIDDDPMQRNLAVFALGEAGHHVLDAANGEAGLALVRVEKPDIVVCDVNMPGMDGFQLLESLRRDATTSAVPVVMLTSMGAREDMRRGMTAGADDYLPKPYQPQELVEAVSSVLARHDARHFTTIELVKQRFTDALARQEQVLAARFENQLEKELSARWDQQLAEQGELVFKSGTLLMGDLFGVLRAKGQPQPSDVAAILQAARDSLYLFGAAIVLTHGDDLLAIFDSGTDDHRAPAAERAVKAAFALQSAVGSAIRASVAAGGLAVALHKGDFTVVVVKDPIHGDTATAMVPSPALTEATSLRLLGKTQRWAVAASLAVLDGLSPQVATMGENKAGGVELQRPGR